MIVTDKMASYGSRAMGRQMGWLRHVLTVLSVIIFVSAREILQNCNFVILICILEYHLIIYNPEFHFYAIFLNISHKSGDKTYTF